MVSAWPLPSNPNSTNKNRVKDAIDTITKAQKSFELLTIYTTLKTYSNAVITTLSYEETAENGAESFIFSFNFKEIEFANAKTVKIPVSKIGKGKPGQTNTEKKAEIKKQQQKYSQKQNKGQQATKPVNQQQQKKAQEHTKPPKNVKRSTLLEVEEFIGKLWQRGTP
jgi:hypothetical protein